MPEAYGRTNARYLESAGSANAKRLAALQKALLGYVGGSMDPRRIGIPGGMTFADLGFEGELVPSAGPMLSRAFDVAGGLYDTGDYAARQGALGTLLSGTPSFVADPALRERFFEQAVTAPAQQFFDETVAPSIAARYGRGGNLGAAAYATGQAGGQLATQLAGTRAGLLRGDEQLAAQSRDAALGRMAQAIPLSYNNQIGPLGLLGQFGALERGVRGELNQGRFQEAILNTPFGDPRWGLLSMLGGAGMVTPSGVSAPQAGGGGLNGLLGLAGGLFNSGLAGQFMPGLGSAISALGGLFG